MNIVKYFYEEPFLLETLAPELSPNTRTVDQQQSIQCYRAYLAGTRLPELHIGLTSLAPPDIFSTPLYTLIQEYPHVTTPDGVLSSRQAIIKILQSPEPDTVWIASHTPLTPSQLAPLTQPNKRYTGEWLLSFLQQKALIGWAEPAHHGFDWSILSHRPLRQCLTKALRAYVSANTRIFILPFQKARSEHRFYFEQWQLQHLPSYIQELNADECPST